MNLFEFDENEKLINKVDFVIGTDEAGRGPAAGGVWAAACAMRKNCNVSLFSKLNDSKKLTSKIRDDLYELVKENFYYSIKISDVAQIEKMNILNASLYAMKQAVEDVINQLKTQNIITIVDGNKLIKNFNYSQKYIIKGDSKSAVIAASSILAKVSRDRFMDEIDKKYPNYDWKNNKGYLTSKHLEAIDKYGLTKYHRPSFLKKHFNVQQKLF